MVRQHETYSILAPKARKEEKKMVQKRRRHTFFYKVADFMCAMTAWAIFFAYRRWMEAGMANLDIFSDPNFYYGLVIIPTCWLLFYSVFDQYRDIYRLSRLATLTRTLFLSFFGVLMVFFTLLLDDVVLSYTTYYTSFITLFVLHFGLTTTSRLILLTKANQRIKAGVVTFNTLIIGGNTNAYELYKDIHTREKKLGNRFIGFVDTNGSDVRPLAAHIPKLGRIDDLRRIIKGRHVEEVIIAIETSDHNKIQQILNILFEFDEKLLIKIIPDMYDILLGSVKMNQIYGAVLIEIQQVLMPKWQRLFKRIIDVSISSIMMFLLLPVYLYIALRVRISSKGPIFFTQERVGINGKPFRIIKFRSMYTDAEKNGPQLCTDGDNRITPWGRTMRKLRLDELPQFWNVLKGDMSLVGPRPERQFYIDQIVPRAPHFKHLLKVRPGITSWGQVKYGYASNVDQMIQRLKYDLLYIENMSLALDFKIMFYTILVVLQAKGK